MFFLCYLLIFRCDDLCFEVWPSNWVCVKYSTYLFCPAFIRGMEGLRSALKATLSSRNSRQIKLSGGQGCRPWRLALKQFPVEPCSNRIGKRRKVTEMGIFKLIIFPRQVRGDDSCHVSYRKHEYTQQHCLVGNWQHLIQKLYSNFTWRAARLASALCVWRSLSFMHIPVLLDAHTEGSREGMCAPWLILALILSGPSRQNTEQLPQPVCQTVKLRLLWSLNTFSQCDPLRSRQLFFRKWPCMKNVWIYGKLTDP